MDIDVIKEELIKRIKKLNTYYHAPDTGEKIIEIINEYFDELKDKEK